MQTLANWYWAGFLLVGFGVFEATALATGHPEATLSETIWRWCDVMPGRTIWTWSIAHLLLLFFMLWLTGHLVWRLWARL